MVATAYLKFSRCLAFRSFILIFVDNIKSNVEMKKILLLLFCMMAMTVQAQEWPASSIQTYAGTKPDIRNCRKIDRRTYTGLHSDPGWISIQIRVRNSGLPRLSVYRHIKAEKGRETLEIKGFRRYGRKRSDRWSLFFIAITTVLCTEEMVGLRL